LKPNEIRERERKERPTTTDNEIHHSQKRKKLRASQHRHGLAAAAAAADSADVIMSGENKKQNFPTHFFGTCFFFSVCCGSYNCLAISQKKEEKRGKRIV
jgi:hypothetical protein